MRKKLQRRDGPRQLRDHDDDDDDMRQLGGIWPLNTFATCPQKFSSVKEKNSHFT